MNQTTLIIVAAVGAGLFGILLLFVIGWLFRRKGKRPDRRLEDMAQDSAILSRGTTIRATHPTTASERFDYRFNEMVRRTQLDVTPEQALASIAFFGVVMAAIGYFWQGTLGFTFGFFLLGVLITLGAFRFLSGRFRSHVQKQLPDAYFQLARSLRTGMSLQQALKNAEESSIAPLKEEWERINGSIDLGLPISQALEMGAQRLKLLDFDAFVSTIALYEQTGGNLALLLDRLATSVRDRNQFRMQFFATTAQGRATAIILGLAVPAILLLYMLSSPERLESFLQTTSGWLMLGVALGLQLIGAIWIFRILKIEY